MLRKFEYGQVYHPTREWEDSPGANGTFQDVYFNSADGVRLNAWFFPAHPGSPRKHQALLLCHGNGGNVSHRVDLCRALLRTGVNVLIFDYRGYGRSEGCPDEEGTYRDAQAAHEWLRARGFEARDIIVFGESLGGAVASELVLRETAGALVLQSAFTSIADTGVDLFPWLPVRWLNTIKYDTLKKLPHIRIPVLVMHSRDDELIRFRHAERNFAAANEPKMFWETNGDHDHSLASDLDHCADGVANFLAMIEASGAPAAQPRHARPVQSNPAAHIEPHQNQIRLFPR